MFINEHMYGIAMYIMRACVSVCVYVERLQLDCVRNVYTKCSSLVGWPQSLAQIDSIVSHRQSAGLPTMCRFDFLPFIYCDIINSVLHSTGSSIIVFFFCHIHIHQHTSYTYIIYIHTNKYIIIITKMRL